MRRQNDTLLLLMQMLLPLLILTTLDLVPRNKALDWLAVHPQIAAQTKLVELRPITALEAWHMKVWDEILLADADQSDWLLLTHDGQTAQKWQALSDNSKLLLGDAYHHLGEKQQAMETWQSIAATAGPVRYQKMINLLRSSGQFDQALEKIDLWLKEDPQNAHLYYQKALFQCVVSPQDAPASLDQAVLLDASLMKSAKPLKQALSISATAQQESYHKVVVGRALGGLGEWDLAQAVFQQAVTQKDDYAEAWAFLSEAQRQLGEDEYPALNRALGLNPHSISAQSLMGAYWLREGRPDLAYTYFYQLSLQEPQLAIWRLQTGDSLALMGQPLYAMVHYQKALELDPNNAQNWRSLVLFCLQNDLEVRRLGLPAVRHLVVMTPDDSSVYDLHGKVLLALHDYDNALQAFERGLKIDPQSVQLFLDIGTTYIEQKRNGEAFQILSKASELAKQQNNPNSLKQAQQILERLY